MHLRKSYHSSAHRARGLPPQPLSQAPIAKDVSAKATKRLVRYRERDDLTAVAQPRMRSMLASPAFMQGNADVMLARVLFHFDLR
jgi:hypothetical protein